MDERQLSRKILHKPLNRTSDKKILRKTADQIVSPLTKYDSKGNLICIICKTVIKSAVLWKVHVNSKQHKHNVEEAKNFNKNIIKKESNQATQISSKKPELKRESSETLKNLENKEIFCQQEVENPVGLQHSSDLLPEMFFDDPVVDAKIRNVDYKNIHDDEWDRFQREIKEESMASSKLIAGEQKSAAVEREIIEISEQIHHWSKVLYLEEKINKISKSEKQNVDKDDSDEDVDEDEDDISTECLDWRSKKFL